jgi:hypothetical protein
MDIVMHVDASGADGTKYCPYYREDSSGGGDSLKFTNLKTKNTFVKFHGWGRIIFQSYPEIEAQGSNLILDIIFRALKIYMEKNSRIKLRNLYIFLDNTFSNKSHCLIGGLACLVLLGKCHYEIYIYSIFILNLLCNCKVLYAK